MVDCFKKVRWGKVIVSGLIFLIIATIVRQIEVFVTLDYYKDPQYFGVWSTLMMPKAGPPPPGFIITSLLFSLITGIILAAFYDFIKTLLPKNKWGRIICYTEIIVELSIVFFTLPAILLFNLPLMLHLSWLVSGVLIIFLSSIVFVKILK